MRHVGRARFRAAALGSCGALDRLHHRRRHLDAARDESLAHRHAVPPSPLGSRSAPRRRLIAVARASLIWPSVWATLGLLLLLGLGTWQVERLHWKKGLIAERQAALHAAPVPLPSSLPEARKLEFHPVKAEGEFLNAREFDLHAQSLRGAQGFHIITPFRLADGTILLV